MDSKKRNTVKVPPLRKMTHDIPGEGGKNGIDTPNRFRLGEGYLGGRQYTKPGINGNVPDIKSPASMRGSQVSASMERFQNLAFNYN